MSVEVIKGSLKQVVSNELDGEATFVVSGLQMKSIGGGERLVGVISDTESSISVGFTSRLVADYNASKLTNNDIIKTTNWQVSVVNGAPKMMLLDATVVGKHDGIVPDVPQSQQKAPSAPASSPLSQRAPVSPSEMPVTPAPGASASFQFPQTPGSAMLTPPMAFATSGVENRQPSGPLPVATGKVVHKPISALNPYQAKWTVKVKIDAKQPMKRSTIKGEQTSILSVVLVDSEGSQIEATFWREVADQMDSALVQGRVYYMSNGSVVPANRKYSTTGHDYRINFNDKTVVQEAPSEDGETMKAKLHFVKVDCLAAKIGKKTPVDMVAIVTDVGSLGSIKRQHDGTEFVRRDITVVDESRKSVMVTLWRDQAQTVGTQLEALTNPIIVMTKMRIGDFNGVSVSSSYASRFEINPEGYTEVKALQDWWEAEGSTLTFASAGDSVTRGGVSKMSKYMPLEAVVPEHELSANDPPIFSTAHCLVARIPEAQSLYYEANPANNKKVEANASGGYIEVGSGDSVERMQRRYVLTASVIDFTKEASINIFNDQATAMLGKSADEVHEIKENDSDALAKVLSKPVLTEWVLNLMAKPREYNGKTNMRLNVRSARPMEWAADSARMISNIQELLPKA
eukprot:jgi/Ulvmu1/4502/UM002_0228.1